MIYVYKNVLFFTKIHSQHTQLTSGYFCISDKYKWHATESAQRKPQETQYLLYLMLQVINYIVYTGLTLIIEI